jgi:transposase
MVKTRELTDFERGKVIGLYKAGESERAISKKTGYGKTTIHNIILKYNEMGAISVAPRSGCSKKLTERDKRHLKAIVTQNRRVAVDKIVKIFAESTGKVVCKNTIKKTLYEMGYNSRTALRKPLISENNRKVRLNWVRKRRSWTIDNWKNVVWSDESRFTLYQNDGKIRVWRLQEEKYKVSCLIPTVKHDGGDIMMWGYFLWYRSIGKNRWLNQ